jgi:hypothetical protein
MLETQGIPAQFGVNCFFFCQPEDPLVNQANFKVPICVQVGRVDCSMESALVVL